MNKLFTKLSSLLLSFFFLQGLSWADSAYPPSDHYDGKRFHNLEIKDDLKSFWQVMKWKWTARPEEWPETIANQEFPFVTLDSSSQAVVTFINHASFLIQLPGLNILTDPIYAERASPFSFIGPKRVRAPGINFENLPAVDVVVISHNHYDHLDIETLKRIDGKFHPLFLVPLGDQKFLKEEGILNVVELDWWNEYRLKDTRIIFTPSQHWSARSLFDKSLSLWGSFYFDNGKSKIYFGGDTGYSSHFKQIKNRYGAPDLSLLPIGAYEPRWFMKNHHMNPEEALKAHLDLESSLSLGMHFGTFQLTDEAMDRPLQDLVFAREALKVPVEKFKTLQEGESHVLRD